jgi:hypothetical protein
MWYHRLELNGGPPLWNHFVQLVQIRFRPSLIDDFRVQFLSLSYRDLSISEDHKIQLFMAGLGQPLRMDVVLKKSTTLDEAIMYAHTYEQRNQLSPAMTTSQSSLAGHPAVRSVASAAHSVSSSSPAAASAVSSTGKSTTKRLSPREIAERRRKGQCFKCDELYT